MSQAYREVWRWRMISCALSLAVLSGCGLFTSSTPVQRAIGIPGAATRTPDFVLPLSERQRQLALLYLNKTVPQAAWQDITADQIAEALAEVTPDTEKQFRTLLTALSQPQAIPKTTDLDKMGAIGKLFDPPGADDEALDSRLEEEIRQRDLRVGRLHGFYFVFYRRYPQVNDEDGVCGRVQREDQYCRLVIVNEVDTRKD